MERLALADTPALLLAAMARSPQQRRRRSRAPLRSAVPPPSPHFSQDNNYIAENGSAGAKRKRGAPFGNRNAAIKLSPHVLAFEARVRELKARAEAAIARAKLVIAASAAEQAPPVHVMVYPASRNGVVMRQHTVTLPPALKQPKKEPGRAPGWEVGWH